MKNLWYSELSWTQETCWIFNAQFFQLLMTANLVMLYSNNIEIPSDVEIQMLESGLIPSKTNS